MENIESCPDQKRCELCGALKTSEGVDSSPDHSAAELIRRLAFIADAAPSLAILLIHHIAGRTEREIAEKLKITQQAVHAKISKAQKTILSIQNL